MIAPFHYVTCSVLAAAIVFSGSLHAADVMPPINLADQAHLQAGEKRFAQNCAYCHGAKGVGGKVKKLQCRDLPPDYLLETITYGIPGGASVMPPWGDAFDETELWELIAYVRSLKDLDHCG